MDKELESYLREFVKACYSRLEAGEQRYGKRFEATNLLDQIAEELIDIANYAFLEYVKISRMKQHTATR